MGVWVGNTEITDGLTGQPVNWLLANVGDRLLIVHDFRVEEYVLADSSNQITINNTNGYLGGGWITDPAGRFANFKIGDTIVLGNYVTFVDHGSATIINKSGNGAIQINSTLGFGNDVSNAQFIVSISTPITALKYRWNFIENNEQVNFFSKVDGSEQLLVLPNADANNTSIVPMSFLGPLDYQEGNASIQGGMIFDSWYYFSTFRIYQSVTVTPFMLAAQLLDAQNGISPSYFFNQACLKYAYQIDALYNYSDPNRYIRLTESSVLGNTGWFNENFNTGITNYSLDSIQYLKFNPFPILTPIPKLELTQNQQVVRFTIKNTTDSPFVNLSSKFVLNFCKAPIDETEYQGKNRNLRTNFVYDRAQSTVGGPVVQGELNSIPGMRVLKDVKAFYISSSEIIVEAIVFFGNDSFSIVNESSNPTYMFWITVEDHTLTTATSDKVSLLVTPSEYFIDTSDPTMVGISNNFLRHFEDDPLTQGVASPDTFPNDELVPYGIFYVDKNGRQNDTIVLKSVTMKVKAKNSTTLEEIQLDVFTSDISAAPVISGNQYVNQVLPRPFHIPTAEIRKNIVLTRRLDLDAADKFYYGCIFPFFTRWEYWLEQVPNDGDFFNPSEPQNGWSKFWHRYTTVSGWGLYYEIRVLATKNGVLQSYTLEVPITSNNFNTNPDWIQESIKTYDPDTLVELAGGGNKYVLGYKDTLVEARFKFNPLSFNQPVIGDIAVNIRIETFEGTGRDESRRISSVWVAGDTWFKSVDTSNKVVITQVGPGFIVVAQCLLDGLQLPPNQKFTIYARLFDKRLPEGGICGINNLRTEDEICLTMEDASPFEIE